MFYSILEHIVCALEKHLQDGAKVVLQLWVHKTVYSCIIIYSLYYSPYKQLSYFCPTLYILLLLVGVFYRYLLGLVGLWYSNLLFSSQFSASFHYWKWWLKSPTIILNLFIFSVNSVSFCFMYFGALLLGVYTFIIAISAWWIDFYIMIKISLSLSCFIMCFVWY